MTTIVQPEINAVALANIVIPRSGTLSNGIPVHIIPTQHDGFVRMELVFKAGAIYHNHPLVAGVTAALLCEGTRKYTSAQIADIIENCGAVIHHDTEKDASTFCVYTLPAYLDTILQLFSEILQEPAFSQNEIDTHLIKNKQEFIINETTVRRKARNLFQAAIYGVDHPYGRHAHLEHYDSVYRNQLIDFHRDFIHASNCMILLTGNTSDDVIKIIDKHLGTNEWKKPLLAPQLDMTPMPLIGKMHFVEQLGATQNAIRIGKIMLKRSAPDFKGVLLLNTLFGGYFGSRIMKNIREEKGYTYGIGSFMITFNYSGYFAISSELKPESTNDAIAEIFNEMRRIRDSKPDIKELQLVKNYFLGDMVRMFDGPFALADSYRSLFEQGLDHNHFIELIACVKQMEPNDIKALAEKYFTEEDMKVVVAGVM